MKDYSIKKSFEDATVLLTGVTGFLGGAVLERLLRLEPGPKKVFVLVRHRQGLDPRDRVDAILQSPLFDDVKKKVLEKVVPMVGDVKLDGLGLSEENLETLLSDCTHVIHSAASISFAAQLESAARINLLGTRYILALARRMQKFRSMVHVSTAYVNCTRNSREYLEEKLYETRVDPTKFADMVAKMTPKELESRRDEFLGNHANTYTFTKHMAEHLLEAERDGLPVAIVRPSLVLNSWKEPISGWVDNVNNGACGFIAGLGKGLFRTFLADPEGRLDIVPVDLVVSTILGAAARAPENPEKMTIYHCTASSENSTNWGQYCDEIVKSCREHPCDRDMVWYPEARPRRNWLRNYAVIIIFHLLPAHIMNLVYQFKRPGEKYILLNYQQKFAKGDTYTRFFATRQWSFSRRNTIDLCRGLAAEERDSHPMDPNEIEWERYFEICVLGTRRFFHKEGASTTDRGRRQIKRLKIIATVTPFLAFFVLWYVLYVLLLPAAITATSSSSSSSLLMSTAAEEKFISSASASSVAGTIAAFFILFMIWL